MKRSREPCEGGSDVPEVELGLEGVVTAGEGDGDGEAVPEESTLGLRVHEWGLNPLFWVRGCYALRHTTRTSCGLVLVRPIGRYEID